MRVLYVEDSRRLRSSIFVALQKMGYAVDVTGDGEDGLWMARNNPYDVVILDINLPHTDGLTILRHLREEKNEAQILMLTAKDTIEDRVNGLQSGADDYLTKPFALEELLARVQALCRRSYGKHDRCLAVADLEVDLVSKIVRRAGKPVDLTAREFSILEYLMMKCGTVVSRTDIESHIYDDLVSPMSNVVDSAMCLLRQKITVGEDSAPLIHTRRGQGYILEERPA